MMKQYKVDTVIAIIELAISGSVAFILFQNNNTNLAYVAAAIGLSLTISTVTAPMRVASKMEASIHQLGVSFQILKTANEMIDSKFVDEKNYILDKAKSELDDLSKGKLYGEIYYKWLIDQTNNCEKSLRAISTIPEETWNIGREDDYYRANIKLNRKNGRSVERIFIINSEKILSDKTEEYQEKRKIIVKHLADKISSFVIIENFLKDPEYLPYEIRNGGIAIFDDSTVYVDEISPPGKGWKTAGGIVYDLQNNPQEVEKYKAIYKKLKPYYLGHDSKTLLESKLGKERLLLEMIEIFKKRHCVDCSNVLNEIIKEKESIAGYDKNEINCCKCDSTNWCELEKEYEKRYLFSWDDIPGNDDGHLIQFLKNFDIDIDKVKTIEIKDNKTITISTENKSCSLILDQNETEVSIIINDQESEIKLIARRENNKLNIYKKVKPNENI